MTSISAPQQQDEQQSRFLSGQALCKGKSFDFGWDQNKDALDAMLQDVFGSPSVDDSPVAEIAESYAVEPDPNDATTIVASSVALAPADDEVDAPMVNPDLIASLDTAPVTPTRHGQMLAEFNRIRTTPKIETATPALLPEPVATAPLPTADTPAVSVAAPKDAPAITAAVPVANLFPVQLYQHDEDAPSGATVAELKSLARAASDGDYATTRQQFIAASLELNRRGIAPRWHGTRAISPKSKENFDYFRDRIMIDLRWLSLDPNRASPDREWADIFSVDGLNWPRAWEFACAEFKPETKAGLIRPGHVDKHCLSAIRTRATDGCWHGLKYRSLKEIDKITAALAKRGCKLKADAAYLYAIHCAMIATGDCRPSALILLTRMGGTVPSRRTFSNHADWLKGVK